MEKPLYLQLRDSILEEISTQAPNTPIKSERDLALVYGTSRMTVRKAIKTLIDEGYLYCDKNKGTFVADTKLHKKNSSSMLFYSKMKNEETKILHYDIKDNNKEISKKLEIPLTDSYINIIRLNLDGDHATNLDEIYIVRKLVKQVDQANIEELLDFEDFIMQGAINQSFYPMSVPVEYARLLGLKLNTPIIMVESTISNKQGKVFAYIKTYTNPNYVNIEITL